MTSETNTATPGLREASRGEAGATVPKIAAHVLEGPWRLGTGGDIVCTNAKIGGEAKLFDIRGWGYLTGQGHGALGLSYEDGARVQDQMAAIAIAAPDLLAALRALCNELEMPGERGILHGLPAAIAKARAAIAKAAPHTQQESGR